MRVIKNSKSLQKSIACSKEKHLTKKMFKYVFQETGPRYIYKILPGESKQNMNIKIINYKYRW